MAFTDDQKQELREQILQIIFEVGAEFRKSTSSVSISRTSTGKPGYEVKTYNNDPYIAAEKTRDIECQLSREYFPDQAHAPGPPLKRNITAGDGPAESLKYNRDTAPRKTDNVHTDWPGGVPDEGDDPF